jgi:hypothetical protein
MRRQDHLPPQQSLDSAYISSRHNNRYGAVLVAVSRFLAARQATRSTFANDTHSCILFSKSAMVSSSSHFFRRLISGSFQFPFKNDGSTSPQQLIRTLADQDIDRGTEFGNALKAVKTTMVEAWDLRRYTRQTSLFGSLTSLIQANCCNISFRW